MAAHRLSVQAFLTRSRQSSRWLLCWLLCWLLLAALGLLGACSSTVVVAPHLPPDLWQDAAFARAQQPPPASPGQALLAMSPAMQAYAEHTLPGLSHVSDPRRALLSALYQRDALRLVYDDTRTRTAAEAFDERAGNCLSLVVMTAAFAKHMGLPFSYQQVEVQETYSRRGGMHVASGHVNLVLAKPRAAQLRAGTEDADLTVDFLPLTRASLLRTQPLQEHTVVAMYLNNRAAELLTDKRLNDAYAWARAAVQQDPQFLPALNTLAVIYLRADLPQAAHLALRQVLTKDTKNTAALTNLVRTLTLLGRTEEAQATALLLAQLQPEAPFVDFERGQQALAAGDFSRAREHFLRELRRQPEQHEVHFWAAVADWHLGDRSGARQHLLRARESSPTREAELRYTAKLDSLRAAASARPRPTTSPPPLETPATHAQ